MTTLTVAPDAALALGIASTAMPFARTPEDQAERWLRVLRLHGRAGVLLHALGLREARVADPGDSSRSATDPFSGDSADAEPATADPVELVSDRAAAIAQEHGAASVTTLHLLRAAMDVYDADFDRVLRAHGTARADLDERLRDELAAAGR